MTHHRIDPVVVQVMIASCLSALPRSTTDILAYSWQLSDDGKSAIVEFVAADRKAFVEILNSKDPKVRLFEKGKNSKDETESELKKQKKDFDPTKFGAKVH